jgi:hypothetical protein
MVRAELGDGNREEAIALLDRMQARYVLVLNAALVPRLTILSQEIPHSSIFPDKRNHARRFRLTVGGPLNILIIITDHVQLVIDANHLQNFCIIYPSAFLLPKIGFSHVCDGV